MYIDDDFQCFTLEDTEREGKPKIPGKTAIPRGTYKITIDMSTRFKRPMPHILDVPGFDGIRIHAGNTDKDTEGCILVGRRKRDGWIEESRLAFNDLFDRISVAVHNGESINIEVIG